MYRNVIQITSRCFLFILWNNYVFPYELDVVTRIFGDRESKASAKVNRKGDLRHFYSEIYEYYPVVLVKNAVRPILHVIVLLRDNIGRVLTFPNQYLSHFMKNPSLLHFSWGQQFPRVVTGTELIAPLPFFHGCRKRRLTYYQHSHLIWTAYRRRWAYHHHFSTYKKKRGRLEGISEMPATPSGIKREWYPHM
jgi:hypothetical protein